MKTIVRSDFIRYKETEDGLISIIRADIACDTDDDIPDYDDIEGIELDMGSLAWDISTGNLYGLDSSHQWILQTGGGEQQSNAERGEE